MRLGNLIVLAGASLSWLGCDPELNEPEQLDTVRVLAVQKSTPYTTPGSEVDFGLLWYDGREDPGPGSDQVELLWFAGCANPPGDLFYWCYLQLAFAGFLLDSSGFEPGDSFTLSVPPDPEQGGGEPRMVDLVRTGNVSEDIIENTARFNTIIEKHIRMAPDNWLWVHRRWRIKAIPERARKKLKGVPV